MEKDKILKVLEKVPSGTKLYSTAFGNLEFNGIVASANGQKIELATENEVCITYFSDGRYRKGGEVTLYPSREMRDWNKFAWEKGDVLITENNNVYVIFEGFENNTYTLFKGKHYFYKELDGKENYRKEQSKMLTSLYKKADNDIAKVYIKTIEKKLGGKFNLKTLEVEKPKFEDGDILTCLDAALHESSTFIFKHEHEYGYSCHAGIEISGKLYIIPGRIWCGKYENIRYATVEEKIKLFDALTKEGKRWNAEKKVIEDIKPVPKKQNATYKKESDMPEHKLEPFEKVLCRDYKDSVWDVDFFGFKVKNENETAFIYRCVGNIYKYCIPYKGNEHLLGTSKDPEEK
nr:MAG TPA: 39S ribosomal protein L2 [Caudoviricetes sp.]